MVIPRQYPPELGQQISQLVHDYPNGSSPPQVTLNPERGEDVTTGPHADLSLHACSIGVSVLAI